MEMSYILLCKICNQEFDSSIRRPFVLNCGHTYCNGCIKQLYKNNEIKCPLDKKVFKYTTFTDIACNYQLLDGIQPQQFQYCSIHSSQVLRFYCKSDSTYLCQECLLDNHIQQQHQICASNSVVNFDDLKKNSYKISQIVIQEISKINRYILAYQQALEENEETLFDVRQRIIEQIEFNFYNSKTHLKEQITHHINDLNQKRDDYQSILNMCKIIHGIIFQQNEDENLTESIKTLSTQKQINDLLNQNIILHIDNPLKIFPEFLQDFLIEQIAQAQNPFLNLQYREILQILKEDKVIKSDIVMKIMQKVDRKDFIPQDQQSKCYQDNPIPIGWNTSISAPHMHAVTLENIHDKLILGGKALDIGGGSGYISVCMALIMGPNSKVYCIDHIQSILDFAKTNISKKYRNLIDQERIEFILMDGRQGYQEKSPFNVIHIGGALKTLPTQIEDQLELGGRIYVPLGDSQDQKIFIVDKDYNGLMRSQKLQSVAYTNLCTPDQQLE